MDQAADLGRFPQKLCLIASEVTIPKTNEIKEIRACGIATLRNSCANFESELHGREFADEIRDYGNAAEFVSFHVYIISGKS